MLKLVVRLDESFNETTNQFVDRVYTLELEHSLVSVSKWESHFKVPFLAEKEKTTEQTLWYMQAMLLTPDIPPEIFLELNQNQVDLITQYISESMTATTFSQTPPKVNRETITSELIYYWMIALNIPFECQYWHLDRLLTLIRVVNLKSQPPKKMNKSEIRAQQRSLNEQRKAKWGTKG